MAIVCKDVAKEYVETNKNFEIAAVVIKNSDLLLKKRINPNKIGISQNRAYQKELAKAIYENVELVEVISSALPYSLYSGKVDGAILDGVKVLTLEGTVEYSKIDTETYVLIVNKEFKQTQAYKLFVKEYNKSAQELNDRGILIRVIEIYKDVQLSQKDKDVIKAWNIKFLKID